MVYNSKYRYFARNSYRNRNIQQRLKLNKFYDDNKTTYKR